MTRYVLRDGKLVEKRHAVPQSSAAAPYVIRDGMDALVHPVTGKLMDSKSAFRQVTKDAGCIEVGNEDMGQRQFHDRSDLKRDIAEAIRNPDRRAPRMFDGFHNDGWQ